MSVAQKILVPKYKQLLSKATININALEQIGTIKNTIFAYKARYDRVSVRSGIPWQFVATLHSMECGLDFNEQLANGDPISSKTINEPVGLPAGDWEFCAINALKLKGWVDNQDLDWNDIHLWLWRAEKYNGWGYRLFHPEIPSPYLWSGTSVYTKGKYKNDGKFDKDLVSQQVGVVPILKALGVLS